MWAKFFRSKFLADVLSCFFADNEATYLLWECWNNFFIWTFSRKTAFSSSLMSITSHLTFLNRILQTSKTLEFLRWYLDMIGQFQLRTGLLPQKIFHCLTLAFRIFKYYSLRWSHDKYFPSNFVKFFIFSHNRPWSSMDCYYLWNWSGRWSSFYLS